MILKDVFFDSSHEYVAKLENGVYIIGFADGTAVGADSNRYRLISHLDANDEVVIDGWELIK